MTPSDFYQKLIHLAKDAAQENEITTDQVITALQIVSDLLKETPELWSVWQESRGY